MTAATPLPIEPGPGRIGIGKRTRAPEEKDAERIRKKLREGLDTVLADEAAAAAGTGKNGG